MDLVEWVEDAESLLRSDGLWPEQDEERARGVLEEAALEGPESLVRAVRALRRALRERDQDVPDQGRGRSKDATLHEGPRALGPDSQSEWEDPGGTHIPPQQRSPFLEWVSVPADPDVAQKNPTTQPPRGVSARYRITGTADIVYGGLQVRRVRGAIDRGLRRGTPTRRSNTRPVIGTHHAV
jgi:hypothetical protein